MRKKKFVHNEMSFVSELYSKLSMHNMQNFANFKLSSKKVFCLKKVTP